MARTTAHARCSIDDDHDALAGLPLRELDPLDHVRRARLDLGVDAARCRRADDFIGADREPGGHVGFVAVRIPT